MQTIKIKYHDTDNKLEKIEKGDFIDLYTAEDVEIRNFEFKKISLGVSMQLPKGYHAEMVPRSSTFGRYGLIQTNHVGVIDETFCGENDVWQLPVYKLPVIKEGMNFFHLLKELFIRPKTKIAKGTRLCQFRIVKNMDDINFEEVAYLGNKDRGEFGSTGV